MRFRGMREKGVKTHDLLKRTRSKDAAGDQAGKLVGRTFQLA